MTDTNKTIPILCVALFLTTIVAILIYQTLPRARIPSDGSGDEFEGFLWMKSYPNITEFVPDVMVWTLLVEEQMGGAHVARYFYLVRQADRVPIMSLEPYGGFGEGDYVQVTGEVYELQGWNIDKVYRMVEVYNIDHA